MAVLSPALVVAMCVMFVFTRLHRHYYIFEKPFLFGLKFCLEPDKKQLQAIIEASNKNKSTSQGKASASNNSKTKINVKSLSIRRSKLSETFFTSDSEFPHHRQFDHIMALTCGYIASFLFEETVSVFFPNALANRRAIYVALFAVVFSTVEGWRISTGLLEKKILWGSAVVATVISLALITAGDFQTFFQFDSAFQGLRAATKLTLSSNFKLEIQTAEKVSKYLTVIAQILISLLSGSIAASMFVPSRRFSRLDYDLHMQYRQDQREAEQDPYYLGRPTPLTMFQVALDYIVPLVTVIIWALTPRTNDSYPSWLLVCVLLCCCIRFSVLRLRMQAYLDSAINIYRRFWSDKAIVGPAEAGKIASFQIIGNSFYLIMLLVAYISPPITSLLFGMIAKLDGAVPLGLFAAKSETTPFGIFCREIAGFLSWWSLAVYVILGMLSLLTEYTLDVIDPQARERYSKLPTASTASETRKRKRMLQQGRV